MSDTLSTPQSRNEQFLGAIVGQAGVTAPSTTESREEVYLKYLLDNGTAREATIQAIVEALKGGMTYKGSVATVADLPAAATANKGWVYTIVANGHEHVSDGTQWIDLSADTASEKVFVATYNVTGATDVAAARTAGKIVFCLYSPDSNMSHVLMLVDESDSKYVFTNSSVSTNNGVTAVTGINLALNKSTSAWEVVYGSGSFPTFPATIENDKYLHTNASTGALEWSAVDSGIAYEEVE